MPARISRGGKPVVSDAGNSDIVVPFLREIGSVDAQERLPMVKIREVLRLQAEGLKQRQIAASVNCSRSTVQECLQRARNAGVGWPIPEELVSFGWGCFMPSNPAVHPYDCAVYARFCMPGWDEGSSRRSIAASAEPARVSIFRPFRGALCGIHVGDSAVSLHESALRYR